LRPAQEKLARPCLKNKIQGLMEWLSKSSCLASVSSNPSAAKGEKMQKAGGIIQVGEHLLSM
jgi:hypothetical protein